MPVTIRSRWSNFQIGCATISSTGSLRAPRLEWLRGRIGDVPPSWSATSLRHGLRIQWGPARVRAFSLSIVAPELLATSTRENLISPWSPMVRSIRPLQARGLDILDRRIVDASPFWSTPPRATGEGVLASFPPLDRHAAVPHQFATSRIPARSANDDDFHRLRPAARPQGADVRRRRERQIGLHRCRAACCENPKDLNPQARNASDPQWN
ncbi:hypothetical protein GGD64_008087 [Bradyrhizobium sp. CIR3A]|nr:hypothetical protein [Bradyrhizobium sp. CIR3A]